MFPGHVMGGCDHGPRRGTSEHEVVIRGIRHAKGQVRMSAGDRFELEGSLGTLDMGFEPAVEILCVDGRARHSARFFLLPLAVSGPNRGIRDPRVYRSVAGCLAPDVPAEYRLGGASVSKPRG